MIYIIIILCCLPSLLLLIDFINFLITGSRLYRNLLTRILEISGMVLLPFLYLLVLDEKNNDCCTDSAVFSPKHRMSIYYLIFLSIIVYFYSGYKKKIVSPIGEVMINSILILGFVLNIFIGIHAGELLWLIGNIPVGILIIFRLIENHKKYLEFAAVFSIEPVNSFEKIAIKILNLKSVSKYPVLFVLCLPILFLIISLLMLFGQKPDSIVKAFTDTYKHGFSQLDYLCENVHCGGHFLCSVAANGHKEIVKPIRYGERNGNKIICNRQLLVANAFEDLLEQYMPAFHKIIRHNYNKIGKCIHRHYNLFNNKIISDFIFILMKPAELIFLVILYTIDQKPENRISKQYLSKKDRELLG